MRTQDFIAYQKETARMYMWDNYFVDIAESKD